MAVLFTAHSSEKIRVKGRRSFAWGCLGTVAYAVGFLVLFGQGSNDDAVADHHMRGIGNLFCLCLHENPEYLGAGYHAFFEQQFNCCFQRKLFFGHSGKSDSTLGRSAAADFGMWDLFRTFYFCKTIS